MAVASIGAVGAGMMVLTVEAVGHSLDLPEGRSELLAEDESPHSIMRAGQGSAIPVT